MTRSTVLVMTIVLAIAVLSIVINGNRFVTARLRLDAARQVLKATARDAQEVISLRQRQERVAMRQRPTQDVIALVNEALAEVGIPSQRLKSLTPESDSAIVQSNTIMNQSGRVGEGTGTNGLYKRQSLRIAIDGLTVQELGAFLIQWRQSQEIWTVSRIELTHVREGNGSGKAPASLVGENRYDASLLISAIYIDQA